MCCCTMCCCAPGNKKVTDVVDDHTLSEHKVDKEKVKHLTIDDLHNITAALHRKLTRPT